MRGPEGVCLVPTSGPPLSPPSHLKHFTPPPPYLRHTSPVSLMLGCQRRVLQLTWGGWGGGDQPGSADRSASSRKLCRGEQEVTLVLYSSGMEISNVKMPPFQ